LGAWLKKNKIAVDIINFGQLLDNTTILDEFWKSVNSNDNSHLVVVPPGPHVLSDALAASPIIDRSVESFDGIGVEADDEYRMV
jgi:26S proteasome regulatory subunit N10